MKICFVCNEYPPGRHGGIGTMTQVLARALVKAGHHVRVIGVYDQPSKNCLRESDQGVDVWRLGHPLRRGGWVVGRWRLFRTVRDWAREGEVDIIEVPDWEGAAAAWGRVSVPVVARLNGAAAFFARVLGEPLSPLTSWLERQSVRRADAYCAASWYVVEESREPLGLKAPPKAIIFNPVELLEGSPVDERVNQDVVFTGTLTPKKGVLFLLEAWPRVLERCPGARLHLYGKDIPAHGAPSIESMFRARLSPAQIATVHFHGHVPRERLFGALRTARLAVFPSIAESFCIAMAESLMCGCPTIYTRLGPGPELLVDRQEALLIHPPDTDELAGAILEILTNDSLARQLSVAGRRKAVANFCVDSLLPQNVEFYRQCVADFRAGHKATPNPSWTRP